MRRTKALSICVVMLLVGAGSVFGVRWWHGRVPYAPEALGATATLRIVDQRTAEVALRPVTVEKAGKGGRLVLGQVAWRRPPSQPVGGSFRIVVLNSRTHLMPGFISVTSRRPGDVATGSDSSLDVAEKRYPWLQGAGQREVDGSFSNPGAAITVSGVDATDASPVTFAIALRAETRPDQGADQRVATAPAAVTDLTVALINVGPDGRVYWAQRLLN